MQREQDNGIVISCDFCGTDWDPYDQENPLPMVEGHHGSVICVHCLKLALEQAQPTEVAFDCTLCLRHREPPVREWSHPAAKPSEGLNPHAAACWPCIRLAAKTFHKDKDVDFRWDPAQHPKDNE